MPHSMTAYAHAEITDASGVISCQLRTVNHRYLDINPRLPDDLRMLEPELRERLGATLARGKVDATIRYRDTTYASRLQMDPRLLESLSELARHLDGQFPRLHVEFGQLLRFPDLLQPDVNMEEARKTTALAVLGQALTALVAARQREGAKISEILHAKLVCIERIIGDVRTWMPEIQRLLRERLAARLASLSENLDAARLEQELVLQATRCDVEEELDRLGVHLLEIRRILGLNGAVGRRLDFLMQELNREANTLGSKSVDARTTNATVELKVLIEQMREQIQNVE